MGVFLQLQAYKPQCPSQVLNENCYYVFLISCTISNSHFLGKYCAFKQLCCSTVERTAFQQHTKQAAVLTR